MSRGRKGSPQESVDSILFAVSRSEDIDDDTMSRYLNRLDEEWAEGARRKYWTCFAIMMLWPNLLPFVFSVNWLRISILRHWKIL